ncbi:MAG: MFS transporter [Actinomycetaceae bacterium]
MTDRSTGGGGHGPRSRPARLLLPAGFLGGSTGWGLTAAGGGASSLAEAYGTTLVPIGLLTTVFAVTYAALQLPAGALVDRWGVRRTALLGMSLTALSYVVALLVPSITVAFVARFVAGAGSAVGFVAGADLARRSGTGQLGLGAFGGMAIGFGGIGVAVIPALEPLLGWRSAWGTAIVPALVAIALVWTMVRGMPPVHRERAARDTTRPHVLRDPELWRFTAVHASTFGLGVVLGNWAAEILRATWGIEARTASLIGSLVLVTTLVSRPFGGWLTSRPSVSPRLVVAGSLVVCAGCTLLLAFPSTPAIAVTATLVIGVSSGLPFAVALAGAQRLRSDGPAAATGVLNGVANFLVVIGTPLLALAIERDGVGIALGVLAALWLVPLPLLPRTWRPDATSGADATPTSR